jgi:hypothetical protein
MMTIPLLSKFNNSKAKQFYLFYQTLLNKSTVIYESDFSLGTDLFFGSNATLQSVNGVSDGVTSYDEVLEITQRDDGKAEVHRGNRVWESPESQDNQTRAGVVSFDYLIPSGNTEVNGVQAVGSVSSPIYTVTDSWTSVISPITITKLVSPYRWSFGIGLAVNGAISWDPVNSTDKVYVKNIIISVVL